MAFTQLVMSDALMRLRTRLLVMPAHDVLANDTPVLEQQYLMRSSNTGWISWVRKM